MAALLTPLFFFSIYALVRAILRNRWVAAVAALLAIGPWIGRMAWEWGPPMGGFYLQFLPHPGNVVQLILIPVWLACAVRYVGDPASETAKLVAILSLACLGGHPMGLLVVPYTMALLLVVSLWHRRSFASRRRGMILSAIVWLSMAALSYSLYHPPRMASWIGNGLRVQFDSDAYLDQLLQDAWVLSPELFSIHPVTLLEPSYLWMFTGALVLAGAVLVGQTRQPLTVSESHHVPDNGALTPNLPWPRALAVLAIAIGPFVLVVNPLVVPWLVSFSGPVPVFRVISQFETFHLACQFGVVAFGLWVLSRFMAGFRHGRAASVVLVAAVVVASLIVPFREPRMRSILTNIISGQNPSILAASADPLFRELADLEPGVVAIEEPKAEFMLMTTPHYAVSSTRMPDERQSDNATILGFDASISRMDELLEKYGVTHVLVRLDANAVTNGGFSNETLAWDATVSSSVAAVPGGESGQALALTRLGYDSQVVYQNVSVLAGATYRLQGFTRSGTSGDEPFAIQIFGQNMSGAASVASVEGRTTASWVRHSMEFIAPTADLSVVLRKNSATPGTMMFDGLGLREMETPLQRFRAHSELFREIVTVSGYAVFAVAR
jgi:hypothetical protein